MRKWFVGFVVAILVIGVIGSALAQPPFGRNPRAINAQTKIIANQYVGGETNLITINHNGHVQEIELPSKNWQLNEVSVSPNGQTIAITGYRSDPDWLGGIFVKGIHKKSWRQITDQCPDYSISWVSNTDMVYIDCFTLKAMKVSIYGGSPIPVYSGDYWQIFTGANPVTGEVAIVEEGYPETGAFFLHRIVIVDSSGNLLEEFPWVADATIWDLEWSPSGNHLMFSMEYLTGSSWHLGLYISDGTSYGARVENDVYLGTWLPDDDYAFTTVDWYSYPTPQTTINLRPATLGPSSLTVKGVLRDMDLYLRVNQPVPRGRTPRRIALPRITR